MTYELKQQGAKQERVYMGRNPLMTVRGTFVDQQHFKRVVVSQLRSHLLPPAPIAPGIIPAWK
ncbi:hypothetical protein [Prosthecobacter sp.]|uniref:hypothetical protein n=1 Tax=Prosthecobacter sp. TaxID=1965333 RepID=UPI003784D57A